MYQYKNIISKGIATLAVVLVMAACVDTIPEDDFIEKPIFFSASRAFDPTRAVTTDIQGPVFDEGETVNVFIKGSSDSETESEIGDYPSKFTTAAAVGDFNELLISVDKQPYYHVGTNSKATIFAAYPANSDMNVTPDMTSFTVQYDQRTAQAYKNSDLMLVAPFQHAKNAEVVSLPFAHKMAKLIVTAIADDGVTVDNELTIAGVDRSVNIDVANGTTSTTFDEIQGDRTAQTIQILNGGAVLFPPQEVTTAKFITVTGTKDGVRQTAQFDIIQKTFEAGRVYKLNLHIGKDDFTPTASGPHTSTITGWSADFDELTVTPSGGYAGVQIADIDGNVLSLDQTVTAAQLEDGCYVYNGEARCPKPRVTYGTENPVQLIEGADFRFAYIDNVNSGQALAMVIGQGSYAGLAAMKSFTIKRAKGRITFPDGSNKTGENSVDFNPDENIGATVVNNTGDGDVRYSVIAADQTEDAGTVSVDAVDGTIILQNVGLCTIKAVASAGRNYDYEGTDSTATYQIQVTPKEVKVGNLTITYEPKAFTYDGEEKKLTKLVVADGEHTLAEGVDYEYTFTNNLHHGNAKLAITGKGNYNASTKVEIDVPINQATPTITVKETELALGIHTATAPKSRKKTREATTEDWAQSKLKFTSADPTIVSVNASTGVLTGLKAGSTTIYVDVEADASSNKDWLAATRKSFPVTVYESDFTFRIARYAYDDYREPQLHIESDGIPEGAHTRWVCPANGEWQIDCYGAQGGTTPKYTTERTNHYRKNTTTDEKYAGPKITPAAYTNQGTGGRGAHIAGRIMLEKDKVLHVNLGQKGRVVYPGEQRVRGPMADIFVDKTTRTNNRANIRGTNGGKVVGGLGYIKAGDYEWAGFAWNGGGGLIWGAHNMYQFPTFYDQDNYWVGNGANSQRSSGAVVEADFTNPDGTSFANYMGQSYNMYPMPSGGGATDVSLAWDEEGGVYTPPENYTDADKNASNGWKYAHNMVNREYGVGVQGDNVNMVGTQWKNPAHLYSRIIVAGGGGGGLYYDSSNTFGDGGDGGAWEGKNGLFNDYGTGGRINEGGRCGMPTYNWMQGSRTRSDNRTGEYTATGTQTTYPSDIVYIDGPVGGCWSGTDGMFGEGGNTFQPAQGCGGGGGGWYGGGAGGESGGNGTGGGGSSFMWTDQVKIARYISALAKWFTPIATYSGAVEMYKYYDSLEKDYYNQHGWYAGSGQYTQCASWNSGTITNRITFSEWTEWHKKASNFYQFMPTNSTAKTNRGSTLGIECPFFHQVVTADTGTNAGDGWAKITLVEIDDEQ